MRKVIFKQIRHVHVLTRALKIRRKFHDGFKIVSKSHVDNGRAYRELYLRKMSEQIFKIVTEKLA